MMARVEPSEVTASPISVAPAARKAAIESVVPPTTTHSACAVKENKHPQLNATLGARSGGRRAVLGLG